MRWRLIQTVTLYQFEYYMTYIKVQYVCSNSQCIEYIINIFTLCTTSSFSFPFIFLEQFRMIWIIGPEIYIKKISLELLNLYVFSTYLPTRDQKRTMYFLTSLSYHFSYFSYFLSLASIFQLK